MLLTVNGTVLAISIIELNNFISVYEMIIQISVYRGQ